MLKKWLFQMEKWNYNFFLSIISYLSFDIICLYEGNEESELYNSLTLKHVTVVMILDQMEVMKIHLYRQKYIIIKK